MTAPPLVRKTTKTTARNDDVFSVIQPNRWELRLVSDARAWNKEKEKEIESKCKRDIKREEGSKRKQEKKLEEALILALLRLGRKFSEKLKKTVLRST